MKFGKYDSEQNKAGDLPREVVDSPSLEIFKQRLSTGTYLRYSRRISRYRKGVGLDELVSTLQLYDSIFLDWMRVPKLDQAMKHGWIGGMPLTSPSQK